uniref:SH3-domain kinase binding protein 1 n=1 Tax=Oryzias latipes TaxID=8090 RepID=H2MGE4_ORYLA
MSLTVGDIITNIRRDDGGWWEGELGGRRGLFPDNFVREIKKEGKRDGGQVSLIKLELSNGSTSPMSDQSIRPGNKGEQIRKRRCKAAFSYAPQHEDELELRVGDVIEIITEVEEGWWEGVLNGKTGMFPSNFTREIAAESDMPLADTPTSHDELRSQTSETTSKDSPGSESDGGDSRSETGSEIHPKKVKGFGFGEIFKDQVIKLRPRSIEVDPEGVKVRKASSVATETMKTEPDTKSKGREQCKVLFPYEAQNEDELTLKEGDIINIITKDCADAGWWMGEFGGRQGVFPDNFVKDQRNRLLPAHHPPSTPWVTKKSEVKKAPPERPEHLPQRDSDRGEEMKVGDIPKPSLPSFLSKKSVPTKLSSSSSSHPPRRPERPPSLACESPKSEGGASTPDSGPDRSHDTDLDAVVLTTEKLSHPTASRPRVTDRRPRSQVISASSMSSIGLGSPPVEDRKDRAKEEHDWIRIQAYVGLKCLCVVQQIPTVPDGKPVPPKPSTLIPPNSSHRPVSLSSSMGASPSPERRHSPLTPLTLEELRHQLKDLRTSIDLLKSQHRQEMKQLTNALDEEKRMRISLQVEVDHIKKSLSK